MGNAMPNHAFAKEVEATTAIGASTRLSGVGSAEAPASTSSAATSWPLTPSSCARSVRRSRPRSGSRTRSFAKSLAFPNASSQVNDKTWSTVLMELVLNLALVAVTLGQYFVIYINFL